MIFPLSFRKIVFLLKVIAKGQEVLEYRVYLLWVSELWMIFISSSALQDNLEGLHTSRIYPCFQ